MSFQERLRWLLRMALLVFILVAAAFLSAVTTIRIAIHGREVDMPDLVGKPADTAQAMLQSRGLRMKVADRVYSPLPANAVVRQSPPADTRMKVAQQAHVVLSLGPQEVKVPALEGKSLRTARIELLRAGLQVGEISNLYLSDVPTDAVVQQDPKRGTNAASPHVNLLVSQGSREPAFIMPHLVGLNQTEAQRQLATAGLHVAKITVVPAPEWPHGAVTAQSPPVGARIAAEGTIELRIAE